MSRQNCGTRDDTRSSALWGTGNRGGDSRANALWGKGGRFLGAILTVLFVTAAPLAGANSGRGHRAPSQAASYLDPLLEAKAHTTPNAYVKVIIQSDNSASDAANAFEAAGETDGGRTDREHVKGQYSFLSAVSATIKAKKVLTLARIPGLTITSDATIELAAMPTSNQVWPTASGVRPLWSESGSQNMPTIAIVDSGIDRTHPCFSSGGQILRREVLTTLPQSSGSDDTRGHGTFVAGIAACQAAGYAGAAPEAKLVDLDVMDDNGMARTSDVIAAAQWIYQNRAQYNIKVANFSLHSSLPSNFTEDPLDKAVEKLWFSGVTVVAAAGNYGRADGPSGVPFAPGNDPFVITVGAIDLEGSVSVQRHETPTWSAYGYTHDGFRKPELSAAGRYMIGPVSASATLKLAKPENVVSPTYMRLSGTSFAAPVVAGAAAQILARHPNWTPDQVKGALMVTARFVPEEGLTGAAGVGEVNAFRAATRSTAPNPNLALNQFVGVDPVTGATVFNAVSWTDAAESSASWSDVSWTDVSWSDASWSTVTWSDVSWSDVTWSDVTWSDVLAAADVSWEDAADSEVAPPEGTPLTMTPEEEAAAREDPLLGLSP
ncbi:MAG TPA: S8 family serine peptidase [Gaiellaceae bacterium]|nr:S8 family serine peptidase [Gaiellaceae bacterium]